MPGGGVGMLDGVSIVLPDGVAETKERGRFFEIRSGRLQARLITRINETIVQVILFGRVFISYLLSC